MTDRAENPVTIQDRQWLARIDDTLLADTIEAREASLDRARREQGRRDAEKVEG